MGGWVMLTAITGTSVAAIATLIVTAPAAPPDWQLSLQALGAPTRWYLLVVHPWWCGCDERGQHSTPLRCLGYLGVG